MFTGNYGFFDYKYNISGYSGQDYGGTAQWVYLAVSAVILVAALILLRKISEKTAQRIIGILGIFMTVFYIAKTAWESYYDIRQSGSFNYCLLPFDTCSLIMPAGILAGFGKGKVQEYAECWIATGGILGGFSTMLFLNAFKYYPFFSFGALYSMLWHLLMFFMGLLIIVTARHRLSFSTVTLGYTAHLIASVFVIPIDFIWNFDFMMYKDLGGVPFFEDIASGFTKSNMQFLNPILMLVLYFVAFCIIYFVAAGIKNVKRRPKLAQ